MQPDQPNIAKRLARAIGSRAAQGWHLLVALALWTLAASAWAQNAAADYTALVRAGASSDFKTLHAPGTSGALPDGSGNLIVSTTHGNVTATRVKVFVPPGSRYMGVSYQSYAVAEAAIAAARMLQPPTSTAQSIVPTEGVDYTRTLQRLVGGEELTFYAPPSSGGLGFAYPDTSTSFKAATGGYLYVNFFGYPGGALISLQIQLYVDKTCYESWYANARFDANGMPSETATHTCAGSSDAAPPPALTGVRLSSPTLLASANASVQLVAEPAGASLASCLPAEPALVTVQDGAVRPNTAALALTQPREQRINCNGGAISVVLNVTPATALTGVALSADTLQAGEAGHVTLLAQPTNASLGACVPTGSALVAISEGRVTLTTAGHDVTSERVQGIECTSGDQRATVQLRITPRPPLADLATFLLRQLVLSPNADIVVISQPVSAALSACAPVPTPGKPDYVTVALVPAHLGSHSSAAVVKPTAAALASGSAVEQEISCTDPQGATARIKIQTLPIGALMVPVETTAADGALTLSLTLALSSATLNTSRVDVWVSARVPPQASLGNTRDIWLLLGPAGWDTLRASGEAARNALAFRRSVVLTQTVRTNPFAQQETPALPLEIALGVPATLLRQYGIELHMAFRIDDGPIINTGRFYAAP